MLASRIEVLDLINYEMKDDMIIEEVVRSF